MQHSRLSELIQSGRPATGSTDGCRTQSATVIAETPGLFIFRHEMINRPASDHYRTLSSRGSCRSFIGDLVRSGGRRSVLPCRVHVELRQSTFPGHDAERERVIALLRAHAEDIRERGVTRLALFGSTARGEAGPSSDVDLLIEVDPHARFTLVDLAGLERFLAGLLLRPVEFAFASRLRERPRIWQRVQADALDVL
jgi:predicted nucleotidyltransferase